MNIIDLDLILDRNSDLAFSYLLGTGVKKNLRLAEFWMWKTIWKGSIHAAANYAQLVLDNTFTKINKSLAESGNRTRI